MRQDDMPWSRTILDLCAGTGQWSQPYVDAGYHVVRLDMENGDDVRLMRADSVGSVHGILAAPPCTEFAGSGARWWLGKGESAVLEGLSVVDACLRLVRVFAPQWWALENPVGRLVHYLGEPRMSFNPCDFGDPYTKKTLLWGEFTRPCRHPVEPTLGSLMHRMSSTWKRQRSATSPAFARAFFEANP